MWLVVYHQLLTLLNIKKEESAPHRFLQLKRGKPLPSRKRKKVMTPENNKTIRHKRQVEKNKHVIKRTVTLDFLYYCSWYTRIILKSKNSPWRKNKNPVYSLKELGIKHIGKNQKKLIYLLHDFFKKGKPVYFNYKTLAKQLDINHTNISKLITSLERQNLIIRENFKSTNKGGNHQVVLMPNNPNYNSNFLTFLNEKLLHQTNKSYFTKQTKNLCKYSKVKRFLTFNPSLTIKLSLDLKSYDYQRKVLTNLPHHAFGSDERESFLSHVKEKKPMRLNLKRKDSLTSSKKTNSLREKFKQRKKPLDKQKVIDHLVEVFKSFENKPKIDIRFDIKDINNLNKLIENQYGFEYSLRDLLNIKSFDSFAGAIDYKILVKYFDLLKNDGKLETANAIKIIEYFNNKGRNGNHKFTITNTNKPTKTLKKLIIVISYYLSHHTMNQIRTVIDRFEQHMRSTKYKYKAKINLLEVLTNPRDEDYLKVFFKEKNDKALFSLLNKINTKFKKEQNFFYSLYVNQFNDIDEGKEKYKQFQYGLGRFVENLMCDLTSNNLNLCGYTMAQSSDKTPSDESNGAILAMYLEYVQQQTGKQIPMVKHITSPVLWDNFVQYKMRDEEEVTNFWKQIYRKNTNNVDNDW